MGVRTLKTLFERATDHALITLVLASMVCMVHVSSIPKVLEEITVEAFATLHD